MSDTNTDLEHPGVVLIVRITTDLDLEEGKRRWTERMDQFRALPGLIQKYYLKDRATGEWMGCYLWKDQASLDNYLASDLRKSIGAAYEVVGAPSVAVCDVADVLRPERL
jgi:hypothetical protein